MPDQPLPLDGAEYRGYVAALRGLLRDDPELSDVDAVRNFIVDQRSLFGPRTIAATLAAAPDQLRVLVRVMVLACSDLSDLHEDTRQWLADRKQALPPWDVAAPVTHQRPIRFGGQVLGLVAWEPTPSVELQSGLDEAQRRWGTALAIGMGERPRWSDDEVCRYAAYLVMGRKQFAAQRELDDECLAERHGVPVSAIAYRRGLPDD